MSQKYILINLTLSHSQSACSLETTRYSLPMDICGGESRISQNGAPILVRRQPYYSAKLYQKCMKMKKN